jgi:hypothetical protein
LLKGENIAKHMYAVQAIHLDMRQYMTLSDNMFQPGVILHEVIAGALRASGSSFDAWCVQNEINRSSARQVTYGQSGGPRGKAILTKMIDDAGREVVSMGYRARLETERKRLAEVAA